jgi:heptosyltransferase III
VERVLDRLPRDGRVAILRLRSLGDSVLTTPALTVLKRYRPDLRLAVFVEPRFREVFEGNPDVEAIHVPELGPLRRFEPDLCLNFHGGTRSAWLTAFSGARFRAGFGHYRHRFAYNVHIPRAQEILGVERKVHTAEHLASAMFHLGAPECEIPRARLFADGPADIERPMAAIHAVAAAADKTWPAEHFLAVAELLREHGMVPVFIGAPADDLTHFSPFRTVQGSLASLKRVLAGSSLFLGNDSGPAHMAAAFGLPCAVIFGTSDPEIWGPWRTEGEILRAAGGIEAVAPTDVLAALRRLKVAA